MGKTGSWWMRLAGAMTVLAWLAVSPATSIAATLAVGEGHGCAIAPLGTVECWGYNIHGEVGDGTTNNQAVPVAVPGVTGATAIAVGYYHTCAIVAGGVVQCWGFNSNGQLGNNSVTESHVPVTVTGLNNAVAIGAGQAHTCAVISGGTVQCWGANGNGQLGNNSISDSHVPVAVSGITTATAFDGGQGHSCALLAGGTLNCWGYNGDGELGINSTADSHVPVMVSGISTAVGITTGDAHSCAVLADGTAQCWGNNGNGRLGNPVSGNSLVPVGVIGVSHAVSIAGGNLFTCALNEDGSEECWGDNNIGELGNGTFSSSSMPTAVVGLSDANELAAGDYSCAKRSDGGIRCWGLDIHNQLGDNNPAPVYSPVPVAVVGVTSILSMAAGDNDTCAVLGDGSANCWGANTSGQLGNGAVLGSDLPSPVPGLATGGLSIASSDSGSHTCAVLGNGTVECWGYNNNGQLGDNSTAPSSVPVAVSGISTAKAVSLGANHSCALLANGTAQCWGSNNNGQLGISPVGSFSTVPVAVTGLANATALVSGQAYSCALISGGTVTCWGASPSSSGNPALTTVTGISGAAALAAGATHMCALLGGGSVKCWGQNSSGQLGNNSTATSTIPVSVSSLSTAIAITAGNFHSCAVLSGGSVQCWGLDSNGQLGNNSTTNSDVPVNVTSLTGASAITAGAGHTCAMLSTGGARCWGANTDGELGFGWQSYYPTPQTVYGTPFGGTTTTITSTAASVVGEMYTVSFTVSTNAGTPTGSVVVSSDGAGDCMATLTAGSGSCSMTWTSAGSHTLTADYTPDPGGLLASSAMLGHTVNAAATTLIISSELPDPSLLIDSVTVTAALVVVSPGSGTPTGSVAITADDSSGCTIVLPATNCSLTFTQLGTKSIQAAYAGDGNFLGSIATPVSHTVDNANPTVTTPAAQMLVENIPSAAIRITVGDAETPAAALVLTATSSDQMLVTDMSLAAGLGGSGASRTLTITPVVNATGGPITITLRVTEGNGGMATSSFPVTITPYVNTPPTFTLQGNPSWPSGTSGLKNAASFAQVTSFGAPNEIGQQVLAWLVNVSSDPKGVLGGVQIQNDGTLTYSLTGQSGAAFVSVQCQDNGGTANGGNDTSAAQIFQISVGAGLDLGVTVSNGTDFLRGGLPADYTILIQNIGTTDAHSARVEDVLPPNLLNATWTCTTVGGATCTASGSGGISDTVDLPVNSGLIYTLTATVQAFPEYPVTYSASVASAGGEIDVNTSNNSDSDTDTVGVFRSGFEPAAVPGVRMVTTAADAARADVVVLDDTDAYAGSLHDHPRMIALLLDPSGAYAAVVHARNSGDATELRLSVTDQAGTWQVGAWHTRGPHAAMLAWSSDVDASGRVVLAQVELATDSATLDRVQISDRAIDATEPHPR
jgi:uncharacterized repeat protein (TIGR01451 family)